MLFNLFLNLYSVNCKMHIFNKWFNHVISITVIKECVAMLIQ